MPSSTLKLSVFIYRSISVCLSSKSFLLYSPPVFGQVVWVLRFIHFGERGSLRERMPTSNYKLGKYSEWEKQWQQITNVKKLTNITDITKQKKTTYYFLLLCPVYLYNTFCPTFLPTFWSPNYRTSNLKIFPIDRVEM